YAFKASLDTFSHFVIYTALGASSTCYFDNVKIYKTKAPSPVEIVSLEFTDELEGVGNPIDTLAGAEAVWASLTAKNYLPIEQKVACIMALYNAANKVQIVQVQEKYADAGSEIPFEMGFGLPTDDDLTGYFVKVFLWDGIQSMIPFVKPQEVPKSDN
ncbi:MAG: hypothetical protein M0R40_09830, partial [Firmicutes bacterium]|nr:hypothetical protein [Bacillota bacterium]